MRKIERHQLIKWMIKEEKLGTQKDIQKRLEDEGIFVTQTTLSRDLREIGLGKSTMCWLMKQRSWTWLDFWLVMFKRFLERSLRWFSVQDWAKRRSWQMW